MPDRLHFTDSDEANALIASDPMALLIGFALDQQVPVPKAFMGPLVLRERAGSLDPKALTPRGSYTRPRRGGPRKRRGTSLFGPPQGVKAAGSPLRAGATRSARRGESRPGPAGA